MQEINLSDAKPSSDDKSGLHASWELMRADNLEVN